jgi:hypothetical protein
MPCARIFLRGDTLLRPERIELQPERLEILYSSDDEASAEEKEARVGPKKKIEDKDLGPRWGPVKTCVFENEPSLFCCRYCR